MTAALWVGFGLALFVLCWLAGIFIAIAQADNPQQAQSDMEAMLRGDK